MQGFLLDLAQFIETRGWLVPSDFEQTARLATPVLELAVRSLNKRWKKVSKAARGLEMLDAEHRHALRKELKKLRYGVEFFGPLFPERRFDAFLKRLKKLQTVFGDLNDAATMRPVRRARCLWRCGSGGPAGGRLGDRRRRGACRGQLEPRAGSLARPRRPAAVLAMIDRDRQLASAVHCSGTPPYERHSHAGQRR